MTESVSPNCMNCRHFKRTKSGTYPKAICLAQFLERNSDGYRIYLSLDGKLDEQFTRHCHLFESVHVCPTCNRRLE